MFLIQFSEWLLLAESSRLMSDVHRLLLDVP